MKAVRHFWLTRESQYKKQVGLGKVDAGTRGAVTGGGHMEAFEANIAEILAGIGLKDLTIKLGKSEDSESRKQKKELELPGYYRPEKRWDMLVLSQGRLVAAIEFKAQVGPSFGNNANNRAEEAIGSAQDIWTAYREKRFGDAPAPFLGYLFLLEDCPKVHTPVRNKEPFFEVDPIFKGNPVPDPKYKKSASKVGVSYSKRYEILCHRLKQERLYTATCFLLSTKGTNPKITQPANDLSFRFFMAALIGHANTFVLSKT